MAATDMTAIKSQLFEDTDAKDFPILFLVPADIDLGDKDPHAEQARIQEQRDLQRTHKDSAILYDIEDSKKAIFAKRPRGRPRGSRAAKEKCSCSNCEAWRRSGLWSETHRCDQCGKTFRVWGHYKAHLLNHNGTRPHPCSECNKSFVRLEDLRRHFLLHGAEFRFQCDKCDKMFYRADHLKNHKKCETKQKWQFLRFLHNVAYLSTIRISRHINPCHGFFDSKCEK